MKKRKYHRMVLSVVVLSDVPFNPDTLSDVCSAIKNGEVAVSFKAGEFEVVDAPTMAGMLIESGNDPAIFDLENETPVDTRTMGNHRRIVYGTPLSHLPYRDRTPLALAGLSTA